MSASSRVVLAVAGGLVAATAVTATATAAPGSRHHRPNLVISALDLHPSGRSVSGTVTVRNIGTARAARSVTSVGSERLATPALRAGQSSTLVVAVAPPFGTTELRVCADASHRVREQREDDNCWTYKVPSSSTALPPSTGPTLPPAGLPSSGVHASPGPPPVN